MTTTIPTREPSLLPYLQPRVPGLALRMATSDALCEDIPAPSAAVVDPCGPLADLLWAQVVLDGSRVIKELFLLVQADHYRLAPSELQPITNADIEKRWQEAAAPAHARQGEGFALGLLSQKDPQGRVVSFRPLFYCRQKDAFGHALCPECGAPLTLCRDDQILEAAGLPGYTVSLARYLFCAPCHLASRERPFYCHTNNSRLPHNVRDSGGLMEDFSALLAREALAAELPCVGCDEAANCYGPQTLVLDRMHPIRFYPFYLIVQPAASLNALDFLALLSKSPPEQIEQQLIRQQNAGRLRKFRQHQELFDHGDGLLFSNQPKVYLELLYLKLAFLHALYVEILNQPAGIPQPVDSMSLNALWIRLPHSGPRLPYLWNFSLQLVDRVGKPDKRGSSATPVRTQVREFLARAWFYVLLVNEHQTIEDVLAVVEPMALKESKEVVAGAMREQISPVLAARNIFWHAPSIEIDDSWHTLWEQCLVMGLALLSAGSDWSEETFVKNLADLQDRVRQALFQTPALTVEGRPEKVPASAESKDAADSEIANIIRDLIQHWPTPSNGTTFEAEADRSEALQETQIMRANEDGDFEETVILSPEERRATARPAVQPSPPSMEETAIISPPVPPKPAPFNEDDLQKTVLIRPEESSETGPAELPPEDLDKTVIIRTQGRKPDDDLEKTVVIGAADQKQAAPESNDKDRGSGKIPEKQKAKSPGPDDLEATVIISRDQPKDRKPRP